LPAGGDAAAVTVAADTRAAVRERPFLLSALRAGVVNYTAAARELDVDGEEAAVATALRRLAEELHRDDPDERAVRVRMHRGVAVDAGAEGGDAGGARAAGVDEEDDNEAAGDPLLTVGGVAVGREGGDHTAVLATGEVDAAALSTALARLATAGVGVAAAGVAGDALAVVVPGGEGAAALRELEAALAAVRAPPTP
jgi:hypothetical protein